MVPLPEPDGPSMVSTGTPAGALKAGVEVSLVIALV